MIIINEIMDGYFILIIECKALGKIKLNALAHTIHAHIHADIHIISCHRNGLLRFVKKPV